MDPTGDQSPKDRGYSALNLTLAAVTGQVGCLTLLIIFLALFGGLWLDNTFQTRPTFTLILLIGSVPFTLIAMFWVVRQATGRMKPNPPQTAGRSSEKQEEVDLGSNS